MKNVLIIDDSKIIRERVSEMVTEIEGVQKVHESETAGRGLELARTLKPDFVVLDIKMSDMNGMNILSDIKQIIPTPVVIILTNYPYPSYRIRCLELGADYFFDKSSEFSNVIKTIQESLNQSDQTLKQGNAIHLKEKS